MTNALVPQTDHEIEAFVRDVMFKDVSNEALKLTLLMCQRYELDPVLKHVVVIKFGQRQSPYITRDGLLHVAHRSGQLDGMSALVKREGDDEYAEATVWRKGCAHPFVYRAYRSEYDTQRNTWKTHPKAMLIKTAEVIALRRAFDVAITAFEEMDSAIESGNGQVVHMDTHGEIIVPEHQLTTQSPPPASAPEPDAPMPTRGTERDTRTTQDAPADNHWADNMTVSKLIDWAVDEFWQGAIGRTHGINRVAAALGVTPEQGSDFAALVMAIQLGYKGSKDDAMRAIQVYEPQSG
jgi:phage recombination protein Bet